MAVLLARSLGTIEAIRDASAERLHEIDGVGPVVAQSVRDFFDNPASQHLVRALLEAGVRPEPPEEPKAGPFSGKTFIITGTLSRPRSAVEAEIRDRGGAIGSSVSKKTDYLIVGDQPGTKLAKAQKVGVEILDEAGYAALTGR